MQKLYKIHRYINRIKYFSFLTGSIQYANQLLKIFIICTLFSTLTACEKFNESFQTSKIEQHSKKTKQKPAALQKSKATDSRQATKSPKAKNLANNSPLWDRVSNNFEISHQKSPTLKDPRANQQIQKHVENFRKNEKTLGLLSKQATPYLYYVVEQIESRNLPGELALLPMIESAYQPHATSPKGAAGLWQFIASTGKSYGLKQNAWYDARRDVKASTVAALDYLEFLYKEFDNDWMLALAAYNAGQGTVHKAIKRNQKAGKPIKFWDLNLPKETKEYVPKFLALANIIGNPKQHNIALPHIENKPYFVHVLPEHSLSFNQVAKFADMPLKDLKKLNPAYRRGSANPKAKGGLREILLPVANAKTFETNFAKQK